MQFGCTPLHVACVNGYREVAEFLIQQKAYIDARDNVSYCYLVGIGVTVVVIIVVFVMGVVWMHSSSLGMSERTSQRCGIP